MVRPCRTARMDRRPPEGELVAVVYRPRPGSASGSPEAEAVAGTRSRGAARFQAHAPA